MPQIAVLLALALAFAFSATRSNAHHKRARQFAAYHDGDLTEAGRAFHRVSRLYTGIQYFEIMVAAALVLTVIYMIGFGS